MATPSCTHRSGFIILLVALAFSIFTSGAFACTTDGWLAGAVGAVNADDPNNGVPRVKGVCGLEVTGAGHVMDGSPSEEPDFIGHFYFLPQFIEGAGTPELLIAYSDEEGTSELFSVKYDGANIIFDATAAGGTMTSFPADTTHWNLVEFDWHNNASGSLWVNSDATIDPPDATFTSGTGLVESVKLGAPNGLDGLVGIANFDEYVSKRDTFVGALLMGDANGNGSLTIADVVALFNELNGTLAEGQPDCNMSGSITIADVVCLFNAL